MLRASGGGRAKGWPRVRPGIWPQSVSAQAATCYTAIEVIAACTRMRIGPHVCEQTLNRTDDMIPFFRRHPADRVAQALQQIADSGRFASQQEGSLPRLPPAAHSVDSLEKSSGILRTANQSGDMITIPNNSSVDIPRTGDQKAVKLFAQSMAEEDSLTASTNSSYCRISELISFSWEPQSNVNLLAIHRTKPLMAYVINTMYHKAFVTGKHVKAKPDDQIIRLVNYENQSRALCKPLSEGPIADIAFSFDSPKRQDSNLVVTIDSTGMINLLSFTGFYFTNSPAQLSMTRLLTIRPSAEISTSLPAEHIRLSWCMYIPGDNDEDEPAVDPSLRLAVTIGKTLEVFTFNDFHLNNQDMLVDRSFFKSEMGEYHMEQNIHQNDIVAVAVSNDGSLTCTASLANVLIFYAIDEGKQIKYLREWRPQIPQDEVIAHSSFLDDIDYLLAHPDQMFWGYLFVATSNGHMHIYDLQGKEWALIQEVNIVCEENCAGRNSSFSYHVDKSSKAILAVKDRSVFVFLLEFLEEVAGTRVPRMKQVARLQLYNEVISFQVKQVSEKEVEIFWITLKNLERCTVDISKLDELVKQPARDVGDGAASLAKVLGKDRKLRGSPSLHVTSPKEQELLNKLQEKSLELNSMKRKHEPASFVATSPASSFAGPDTRKTAPAAVVNSPATPSAHNSDHVTSLLGKLNIISNGQPQPPKGVSAPSFSSPVVTSPASALNDMAKIMLIEDKLKTFENKFTKQFELLNGTIAAGFRNVHIEVNQLKAEIQQPSAARQTLDRSVVELTINKVVEKSLKQMNVLVSKGLKDFFDQTDVGIGELQTSVVRSNSELKSAFGDTRDQVAEVKSQMDLFVKQMERLDAQQQLLLFRYQQLIDQQ